MRHLPNAKLPGRDSAKVDLRPLKEWVFRFLPQHSLLRELILTEDDFLPPEAFLAKMEVWLRVLEREKASVGSQSSSHARRAHWSINSRGGKDGS